MRKEFVVCVGSGKTRRSLREYFEPHEVDAIAAWKIRARAALAKDVAVAPVRGTLAADVQTYLRDADITKETKKRRTQQLAWWCAQPAALGGPVLSPEDVAALAEQRGPDRVKRLGSVARATLDPKRLREILKLAFAATDPDRDPTEHASTSNAYRTALVHLCSELDQDDPYAVNPLRTVRVRPQRAAKLAGQDARIVREILRHIPSRFGQQTPTVALRIAVLAWVHITPKQLAGVDPARDFHDQPDATREDIIEGAITLTKRPRLKGRKGKRIPLPETIPLNPYGVEALRAMAAHPEAWVWGKGWVPFLNRVFKRACRRAQAALAQQGVVVDLSGMTVYHLKHSLATTATLAATGLIDRRGHVVTNPGLQRALDHANPRTTTVYTQAAVDPAIRHVNALTSRYLDHLFTVPLTAPPALKLVAK